MLTLVGVSKLPKMAASLGKFLMTPLFYYPASAAYKIHIMTKIHIITWCKKLFSNFVQCKLIPIEVWTGVRKWKSFKTAGSENQNCGRYLDKSPGQEKYCENVSGLTPMSWINMDCIKKGPSLSKLQRDRRQ